MRKEKKEKFSCVMAEEEEKTDNDDTILRANVWWTR